MDPRHVVVIGAGFAGLEAARRVAAAGHRVSLLERDARAGGRAAEVTLHGVRFDPGAHAFSLADRRLLARIAERGLRDAVEPLPAAGQGQLHGDRVLPIQPQTLLGVARIPGAGAWRGARRLPRLRRLLGRYGPLLDRDRPERAAPLDDRSALEFGRLYFGPTYAERWIEPALVERTLGGCADTSRVLFLLQPGLGPFATRARLRTGLGALADALAAEAAAHVGVEAVAVREGGGGGLRVDVAGDGAAGFDADAVIVATPAAEAARLCDALLTFAERAFFAEARSAAGLVLSVVLRGDAGLGPQRIRIPPAEGLPLALVACERGGSGGAIPDGHAVVTLVARDDYSRMHLVAPAETVEKELLVHGERVTPALQRAPVFTQLTRHVHAYPRFDVGRFRAIGRFQRVQETLRRDGRRLYFAGDHLVGPSVEAALASGARAADAAIADLSPAPARRS